MDLWRAFDYNGRMATSTTWPTTFAAGTTVKATRSFSDYSASDGWSVTLYVVGASVMSPVVGSANGSSFDFTMTATATAGLLPGTYVWRELASKAGENYIADSGTFVVSADVRTLGAGDAQSFEEKALALVEARLLARYSEDMETFAIAGRSVAQIPHDELLAIRDSLIERIRLRNAGSSFVRDVLVRFTGTGAES